MSYGATNSTEAAQDVTSTDTPFTTSRRQDAEENEVTQSTTNRIRKSLSSFYDRNFGLFLVFLAQTCGSIVRGMPFQLHNSNNTNLNAR